MPTTFISTDIISAGIAHTFTADSQNLVLASNTNLVSTGNAALSDGGFDNLGVTILGTLVSDQILIFSGDSNFFHIAQGGTFISNEPTGGNAAISELSDLNTDSLFRIDGLLSAPSTIGILTEGDSQVFVSGHVSAGTTGVFLGLSGAANDSLVNSGTITGGQMQDYGGSRHNNGVLVEGDASRITNLEGGVISSLSIEINGSGIEYQDDVSGARLRNYGEINALNGWGVDLSSASNVTNMSLINYGTIQGGAGSLRGDSTADTFHNRGLMDGDVDMGAGNDTFDNRAGDVDGDVLLGAGDDFYDGRLDAYVTGAILGGDGDDVIYGGHNADLIEGGENNDELRGNGGDDEIRGDNGDDMMLGNDGDDEIIGGNGNDSLFGGRGNDVLNGGNDNDRINGGDGDDRIIAGGGTDILFGDGGADTFTFASVNDSGMTGATRDRIFDFDQAEGDVVFLASIDANDNVGGNQVFSYIAGASFSNTAGELRYTSSGMIEGDTDGDGSADFQILLTTAPTLTVDAFVL